MAPLLLRSAWIAILVFLGVGCADFERAVDLMAGPATDASDTGATWIGDHSLSSGLSYLMTFPPGYVDEESGRWPLVVFLHGRDERGRRIAPLFDHREGEGIGLAGYALSTEGFSSITLSPVCPRRTSWSRFPDRVWMLIRDVMTLYRVDPDRVFLLGFGMGGTGVWTTAMAHPELFAAAAAIGGRPYRFAPRNGFAALARVPMRVFESDAFPASRRWTGAVDRLLAAGGDARIVSVEGSGTVLEAAFASGGIFDRLETGRPR